MTNTKTSLLAALVATLGLAAACWGAAVPLMSGMYMDMSAESPLGSFTSFMLMWMLMMAAMMLPGMTPTVFRHVQISGHAFAALSFVGSYLTVWACSGIPIYLLYQSHGTFFTGILIIAIGLYEFTPFKRFCRLRCCESIHSGLECGLYCVGSCIGLMLMQVVLGIMSATRMVMITILVIAQKLLPSRSAIDISLGMIIFGLGILILISPSIIL